MRIAWCIAVLAGCYTQVAAPPVAPTPPEPIEQVDERRVPDRTYRKAEASRSCDDDVSFDCLLITFTAFRDRSCACTDKVCADAVLADMATWSQNLAAAYSKTNATPTPEQSRVMADITNDFSTCLSKAMMAPGPGSPPTP